MSVIQTIKDELKEAQTLKLLSSSFTEISAIKMKSSREQLRQNSEFYEDIKVLYRDIRVGAEQKNLYTKMIPQSQLSVALTSNKRFYGTQNRDIIQRFLEGLEHHKTKGMVIGLTGQTILATTPVSQPIEVIIFRDDYPSTREIYNLLSRIEAYEKVYLYHPKFVNLMVQEATVTDMTYTPSAKEKQEAELKTFIYEPELEDILNFFETHVRFLLFRRSLLEVELARTSARLVAMISAESRATQLINKKSGELSRAQKSLTNARLIETISGAKRRWSQI